MDIMSTTAPQGMDWSFIQLGRRRITNTFQINIDTNVEGKFITSLEKKHPEYFTIKYSELSSWKKVGEGSYGIVYRAKYKGQRVAAKRIYASDKSIHKYINREISYIRLVYFEHSIIFNWINQSTYLHESLTESWIILVVLNMWVFAKNLTKNYIL